MKLDFLGTRGNIEPQTPRHQRHTATMASYRGRRVLIDCGADWLGRVEGLHPHAIVLTHAHPDHAWGLQDGAPCPVHATARTWAALETYPIPAARRRTVRVRDPAAIAGMTFEAFAVVHSTRAPAVGYRITAGRVTVFYVPDVVYIEQRDEALAGCNVYVGDGASLDRDLVRKERRTGQLVGHTPVRTQLTWCARAGVPRMIVTHCGSQIVAGDPDAVAARLAELAAERGVRAEIATDGMARVLR